MRVKVYEKNVAGRYRIAIPHEFPLTGRGQSEPIAPECNERRLAEFSSEIGEEGLVGLELKFELAPQAIGDAQHEDRLPAELGRRALLLRSNIGRNQRAPARPFAEFFRRKAG